MKKRLTPLAMALVMLCSLSVPVGAITVDGNVQGLSNDCIDSVEAIFAENSMVCIIDADGNDVTEEFISENQDNYRVGDYVSVLDSLIDQNLAIEEPCIADFGFAPMSLINGSVNSSIITKYFDSPITGGQTKEWVKLRFTGTYRVNDYNNTIDSGVGVTGTIVDRSTSALSMVCAVTSSNWTITNNRKTITFTVGYAARIFISPGVLCDEQVGTTTFSKALS